MVVPIVGSDRMASSAKTHAVQKFLRGDAVSDVAVFFGVRNSTIEQVLREAIRGLAKLKVPTETCAQCGTNLDDAADAERMEDVARCEGDES